MRPIDANALKTKLKIDTNTATYSDYCNGYCDARQVDLDAIDAAPTIEAEPVQHGRWETWGYVFHGIEWKRCSRCGKCADVSYYGMLDGVIRISTPSICGGCGARMDAPLPEPPEKE